VSLTRCKSKVVLRACRVGQPEVFYETLTFVCSMLITEDAFAMTRKQRRIHPTKPTKWPIVRLESMRLFQFFTRDKVTHTFTDKTTSAAFAMST